MANVISYTQLIEVIKDIATRHYMINGFYLGKNWEVTNQNNSGNMYPLLQVYPTIARLPINDYGDYNLIKINLNCKVVDLVTSDEDNEKDTHSDMLQIAQDVITEISQHPYYNNSNIKLIEDIQLDNLEEYTDDNLGGWSFDLVFQLINNNSFCGLPFTEIDGYSFNGVVSTGYSFTTNFLTCASVTACTSLQNYISNAILNITAATPTLTQVLTQGNTTSGKNIIVNQDNQIQIGNGNSGISNFSYLTDPDHVIIYSESGLTNSFAVIQNGNTGLWDYSANAFVSLLAGGNNAIQLSNSNDNINIFGGANGVNIYGNTTFFNNITGQTLNLQTLTTDDTLTNVLVKDSNNDIKLKDINNLSINSLSANTISATTYYNLPTYSIRTFMFANLNSDISGYTQMVSLSAYISAATGTKTATVTTTPTLLATFATNSGFPNMTVIPSGLVYCHYETKKAAGSANYYSYWELWKRTSGGVETLITTSDNSSTSALNTTQQITSSAFINVNYNLNTTDRLLIRVYATMLTSSASISLYFDDATNARLDLPATLIDITNFVPYNGAFQNVNLNGFTLTANRLIATATTSNSISATTISGATDITTPKVKAVSNSLILGDNNSDNIYLGNSNHAFTNVVMYAASNANGYSITRVTATNTLPNFVINRVDTTTGIGGGINTVALITSGVTRLIASNNGISATTITATSAVFSSLTNTALSIYGSGTTNPIFRVQGSSGQLMSVKDSLIGTLCSINDISGLPILKVVSDNTVLMGSYQAPSLNTTVKISLTAGTNPIYYIPTSAYTGAFVDYTLMNSSGARAGNIMSIWSGTSAQYSESFTSNIGSSTSNVTFSIGISGNYAVFSSSATTSGTTVRCIIRSI